MGDSADPLLRIVICILLIVIDALTMAYYSAVSSISDSDLEPDEDGRLLIREGAIEQIRKDRERLPHLLRSVWFWLILTSCLGCAAVSVCLKLNRYVWALILTAAVYLFGAALPYNLGKMYEKQLAGALSGICNILNLLTLPFTAVLSFLAGLPAMAAGKDPKSLEDEVTEDEILSMVNEGHEQGAIDEDEAEMISNIFQLDDKQAHDIMTHRGDIDALEASLTLDDAIRYMVNAPNSRFPVFDGSIDNIIGALYLRDATLFHLKGQYHDMSIARIPHLLREVKFIPETVDLDELFRQMQESRKQMVIVVDEYGQTSGLVTMEDILEEIVGNILDEYDSEEKLIAKTGDGHLRMNGKALLEDVEKVLHKTIDQEDYDTLSGYLTEKLGHIPTAKDRGRVIEDASLGYQFRILSISGTMIGWLDVTRVEGS
jgi:putative hemolysin